MVSRVYLSHLTQVIQRSSIDTCAGWTFPTGEFQMFPSKQKLSVSVFFASIHYGNQGLNESVKLWMWMLLPSLTLQIRQCCWKSVPRPACTKKPITATKKGEGIRTRATGASRGWALPYNQDPSLPMQLFSSLPKTHLAVSASVVATDTHVARGKNQIPPLSCLSPLLRLPCIMCYWHQVSLGSAPRTFRVNSKPKIRYISSSLGDGDLNKSV